MRVVWKDSKPKDYKPVKYRDHMICGSPYGWWNNIPGDDNVYATHYDALNAIDAALGGNGQMGSAKRQKYDIRIVGKKSDDMVCEEIKPKTYKPVKYRKHMIYGSKDGWWHTVPGDDNLYETIHSAMNAIDAALGDNGRKKSDKRLKHGIRIVGKKSDVTA